MFKITYKKQALKYLQKMPAQKATRFMQAFRQIAAGNETGLDIAAFQGLDDAYRLRIGDFRAIYTRVEATLVIEVI